MKKVLILVVAVLFFNFCSSEEKGEQKDVSGEDLYSSGDSFSDIKDEKVEKEVFDTAKDTFSDFSDTQVDAKKHDVLKVDTHSDSKEDTKDTAVEVNPSSDSAVGNACTKNSDCGSDGVCLSSLPEGYCSKADCKSSGCPEGSGCFEFTDGSTYCLKYCESDSECRTDDGYVCDQEYKICWTQSGSSGTSPVGGACTSSEDCKDQNSVCYPEIYQNEPTGFTNGYCIIFNCQQGGCPEGSECFKVSDDGTTACLPVCEKDSDCREDEGYKCSNGVCFPLCTSSEDCPQNYTCGEFEKFCINNDIKCSLSNPDGYCYEGYVCQEGECKVYNFTCTNEDPFEPNEKITDAKKIEKGDYDKTQICENDVDWFKLTAIKGGITTIGITFKNKFGDLNLLEYDIFGNFLDSRWGSETYPSKKYETDEEFLTVLAAKNDKTFFYKVLGFTSGDMNDYKITVQVKPFYDGAKCTNFWSADECKGQVDGKPYLFQFPYPDKDDGYVGEGYMFDSLSNYRWARMELIMLIRYAIKKTKDQFPGTKPLGLIDICQHDGITPGYDIGDPRHPPTTHDQGGNIDVAYYQTVGDNHAKVVCDPYGGSTDGYYCTDVSNHIVDLERTVYFLSIIFESPRFRIAGVDKLIAPLLISKAKEMHSSGVISDKAYEKFKCSDPQNNCLYNAGLAYGDGWPFHHHHIHISLKWWSQRAPEHKPKIGCGFRMPGDGPYIW